MKFWKKKNPDDQYDEHYARRPYRERRDQPVLWVHLGFMVVLGITAMGVVWAAAGQTMAEKSAKELASPVGIVWLLLMAGFWIACLYRHGQTAIFLLVVWAILTAGGNAFVKQFLVDSLERPWLASLDNPEIQAAPKFFDLVVVLGGGTTADPQSHPQLASSGDRVMTAAQLFHLDQTRQICVTGEQSFRTVANDPDPSEEARDLLIDIGVPADLIVALRGKNTSEEMMLLRKWLDGRPGSKQWNIGLITSAWHMSRAMQLAKQNDILNIEAIPADWLSTPWAPSPQIIIPSASNLDISSKMLHEHLGKLIGR